MGGAAAPGGCSCGRRWVTALSRALAHVVLEVQHELAGSRSYQDGVNTRLRGALRTTLATMPPPFGGDERVWSAWVARAVRDLGRAKDDRDTAGAA